MTDHRNVVCENFFRDFGDVTLVQNLFKSIRGINRTNPRPIWTPTCEDIDHIAKTGPKPPPKKNPQNHIRLLYAFKFVADELEVPLEEVFELLKGTKS